MRVDFLSDLSAGFLVVMDKWDAFCVSKVTPSRHRGPPGDVGHAHYAACPEV